MAADALATIIATALEAGRAQDEERLRQLEARIAALEQGRGTPHTSGWMTPPKAAESREVSLKRVRALVSGGAVETRLKNASAKVPKMEINLASLDAALAGEGPSVTTAATWAARRAAIKKGAA